MGIHQKIEITYQGMTRSINEWSHVTGISHTLISKRYHQGLANEEIFQSTVASSRLKENISNIYKSTFLTAFGMTKHIEVWAKENDISRRQIERRLKAGKGPEEAVTSRRMKKSQAIPSGSSLPSPQAKGVGGRTWRKENDG